MTEVVSSWFMTLFWMPLIACRYVAQEPSKTGGGEMVSNTQDRRGLRREPARRGFTTYRLRNAMKLGKNYKK